MHRVWNRFVRLIVIAALVVPAGEIAGDLAVGRATVEARCQTCHGMDGVATLAMAANLSGQQREYLIIQLQAFRSDQRQHPQMSIIAQSLSDDDIENVAEWYSSIKVSVEMPGQ